MGSIYRSEHMKLCQIFFQSESAYQCVAELGELGMAQFIDLNEDQNSYQKKFVNEIRRCEEMERKINFLQNEIINDTVSIPDCDDYIPAPQPKHMVAMEDSLESLEQEILQINKNTKILTTNHVKLLEMKAVLENFTNFVDDESKKEAVSSISEASRGESGPLIYGTVQESEKPIKDGNELKFVTGVVQRTKTVAFERFIWRISRANIFSKFVPILEKTEEFSHDFEDKCVFFLFFSGEYLREKVKKICNGFQAKCYEVPENHMERASMLSNIILQANDMKAVIEKTLDYRAKCIHTAAGNLRKWGIMLLKLKSIFHTLNMFSVDVTQKCLIAECWVPEADIAQVKNALHMGTIHSGSTVPAILNEMETHKYPPTYFKLNKFTQGFQNIVDAYGIANYREVNPAPWTIISFPFLFAVMFGDSGHGIIMLIAAAAFVIFEKKLISMKIKDEIFNTFFGGRYVVLLMGFFAVYTGFIYNDFYSKSINIFGSSWVNPYNQSLLEQLDSQQSKTGENGKELMLFLPPEFAFNHEDGPYPFGVDPIWNLANNRLNFLNPMKMKMSVLLGISQMTLGIMLSLLNHIGNRSVVDIFFVFIPQCLFLGCIFVYLCLQIITKWIFFYVKPAFIFGLSVCSCSIEEIRTLLMMWIMEKEQNGRGLPVDLGHGPDDDHGEFNFGDIMVHQAIHTIEFVLGCVSHTASYLRLWALSLAHAQLSEVLWIMVLRNALKLHGWLGSAAVTIIFYFIFSILSVCILILMEGLSAFLHAIRLHWVEFQSKFYGGTGIQFEPFSFTKIIRVYDGLDQIMELDKLRQCEITVKSEFTYQLVAELKSLEMIQFIDLNGKNQECKRKFEQEMKRCDEMEQKINLLENEVRRHNVRIPDFNDPTRIPEENEIDELETKLDNVYDNIMKNKENTENLFQNRSQLIELQTILENVKSFGLKQGCYEKVNPDNRLEFLAGIIKSTDNSAKTTFLRRISRAQIFAKLFEIQKKNDMIPNHSHEKFVFILFFSGEKQRDKVKLICDGFKSKCYTIPEDSDDRSEMLKKVTIQIDQMKGIIKNTFDYRLNIIYSAASNVKRWREIIRETKTIYYVLEHFTSEENNGLFRIRFWIPEQRIDEVESLIQSGKLGSILTTFHPSRLNNHLQINEKHILPTEGLHNFVCRF
ncbi:unnamed protein product [Caenorhabditis brenneri]